MRILTEAQKFSTIFKDLIKNRNVKIFAHIDADGISSASIFSKMLMRANASFELKFLKQLNEERIENIDSKSDDIIVFLDFGSSQLDKICKKFKDNHVFILDHHSPKISFKLNLFHLNPLIYNEEPLSSSAISYIFSKFFDIRNVDLINNAIIGLIGDEVEEGWKLKGYAKNILKEAEVLGKIEKRIGLRIFRYKPIHLALSQTFDPYIPGISGNESSSVQFLSEIGISLKKNGDFRLVKDLSFEEEKRLASAIILQRLKLKEDAEDVFGEIYLMKDKPEEFKECRTFSSILNSCGRLGYFDYGLRICLNDFSCKEEVLRIFDEYRKVISRKIEEANEIIEKRGKFFVIRGEDKIEEEFIGTIVSILSKSINTNLLIGVSRSSNGILKISARCKSNLKLPLHEILKISSENIGEAGGHEKAGGAFIKEDKIEDFLNNVERLI